MDEIVWSGLPADLLGRIMQFLPAASLLQQRTVSKSVYQITSSPQFLEQYRNQSTGVNKPWLLLFQAGTCNAVSAYDSSLEKWHRLPLDFLPVQVYGLASAGGLLLCKGEVKGIQLLYICNPVTRTWRELPPMQKKRWVPVVGLVNVQEDPNDVDLDAFKVMVAGDDVLADGYNVQDLTSEVYDSRTDSWKMTGCIPEDSDLDLGFPHCNGSLYSVTYGPYGVLSYNLKTGLWSKVQAAMPEGLMTPSVVECNGRLFLVGGVGLKPAIHSIKIWMLDESAENWEEVARMPPDTFDQFFDKSSDRYFNSVGRGSFICLMIYESPEVVRFDMELNTWTWLPKHRHHNGPGKRHWLGLFFNPRLSAVESAH
ncbi:hypothetical protein Mapa_007256 [Marchantia paleacea]|nr:hypothetical protein Mapa_007256 [Marchantia paleacea]